MRIAIDASSLLTRHPRGEGKTLLRLYEEIAQIRPEWSFVFIGARMTDAAREISSRIPNSEIRVFDLPGYRWNLWENFGLPLVAWFSGAKLLHCSSSGAPVWSPLPLVMTVHDLIPLLMNDGMGAAGVERFRKRLESGIRSAKKIIAVSDNSRLDLARLMNLDPDKIDVVYWGTDISSTLPAHTDQPTQNLILGFGGGGSVRKNTPALIRMFARIAAMHPETMLRVLGVSDPTQQTELQELVNQLSLQHRVELMGYVSDAELEGFYAQAACLVYISLYEGFGLPPLEAMAHGVPSVASNRSSIPEVVGDAGILVDPERIDEIADAVLKIVNDRDLRQRLSNLARQRAQRFSWRETAEKTIAIFEDALRV